jgi:hypothetical protein
MTDDKLPPKVFISYSWDDDGHRTWVRDFAARLRRDGVNAILDQWEAVPGAPLPEFMERAVRESDFVICICTPRYKEKCNNRGGGVGYEGGIMTGEAFVYQNQLKFIPVLRRGVWSESAPSWLLGKYCIDLCGDPYSEENYADLMKTLFNARESAPPIGKPWQNLNNKTRSPELSYLENGSALSETFETNEEDFEFVNREIELATLSPAKLRNSYWQWALISAPTGYGKTRLLKRLIENIESDQEFQQSWNYRYIDITDGQIASDSITNIFESICGKTLDSSSPNDQVIRELCNYILDRMSTPLRNGPSRGILLIFDSIEKLTSAEALWLSAVLHEVITGSYIDYQHDQPSFPVRIILSGINTESFLRSYEKWEVSSGRTPRLRAPHVLTLSPFKKVHVEELISWRARKKSMTVEQKIISDIAEKLLYFSGGHPGVINGILDELFRRNLRRYEYYLKDNCEGLVRKYFTRVVQKILFRFPGAEDQKNIKTICIFRLIGLNTIRRLLSNGLVTPQANIQFLGSLCENKILKPPSAEKPFYHDDIIRRILYLDFAFANSDHRDHIQKTHRCALDLYHELIEISRDPYSVHNFIVEWLFHAMQITDFMQDTITREWKSMCAKIQSDSIPTDEIKRLIWEKLETDNEIRYLYFERFGSEDFSKLFE